MTDSLDVLYIDPLSSIKGDNDSWYKVLRFLGKGGSGLAFLVVCTGGKYQGCIFTLKVFYKLSDQQRQDKFIHEIEFLEENSFPTLLRQYDRGTYYGRPFVIIDYMTDTLEKEIQKGALTMLDKLLYTLQLLSAVKYLHSQNLVHRDIKPSNIFIKDNTAVLGDFGLIKKCSTDDTEDLDDFKGYYAMPRSYRTPELVAYANSKGKVRLESDIFQLGLVLCELFIGRNPLKDSTDGLSEIEMNPISFCSKGSFLNRAIWIIKQMLIIDTEKRMSIDDCLQRFNKLCDDYSKKRLEIDGTLQ